MATGTITCKGGGEAAALSWVGAGCSEAQAVGDSAMLWPPAASALPSAASAGSGGLVPDPLSSPSLFSVSW